MALPNNQLEHLIQALVTLDNDHLEPWDHYLTDLGCGHLDNAAEHLLLIRVEDTFSLL